MDPPPPTTANTTATATVAVASKLRLMCSYGGHIITRLPAKSLYYAGGDTRIITIPAGAAANLTLCSLTTHLATTLYIPHSFTLKYQLPNHDLDSLISVSTDEDLLIMLDEHHRLSPSPSRIRLFIFPTKTISTQPESTHSKPSSNPTELTGSELRHPKTESWFVDALKSAKIMQKGGVGYGGEMQCEGNSGVFVAASGEMGGSGGGLYGAESIVLETSSSFGSTSSSVSSSNLPAKSQLEDSGAALQDDKVKLYTPEPIARDNNGATAVSHPQTGTYNQDPVFSVTAMENKVAANPFEPESNIPGPPTEVEMNKPFHVSGFPLALQFDQTQQLQFVQRGATHYIPQNPVGVMPTSYYVVNSPVPQQQLYYQTNQPQPICFMPVGQPCNLPMQSGLINSAIIASNHPPLHPNSSLNPAHVAYRVTATSPVPDLASQIYRTVPMSSHLVNVPYNENHQAPEGPQVNHQAQSVGVVSTETANYGNELEDDLARVQLYKSQPSPPMLSSQYQNMTKATTVLSSETGTVEYRQH